MYRIYFTDDSDTIHETLPPQSSVGYDVLFHDLDDAVSAIVEHYGMIKDDLYPHEQHIAFVAECTVDDNMIYDFWHVFACKIGELTNEQN